MPSFFKHSNANAKGVQKTHVMVAAHKPKPTFHVLKKTQSYFNYLMPQNWFFSPAPPSVLHSGVFEANDCIWYYGTLYVKEAVAVARLQQEPVHASVQEPVHHSVQCSVQCSVQEPVQPCHPPIADDADDDAESVSSGNSNCTNHPRNVGKQNQLKYLKDGMRLRHMILLNRATHEWNEWLATFDVETNRIIRTSDGVAFDTLRQFARLHCNEILATTSTLTNVWSDPHFQYQDDVDGQWYQLSQLKQ